MAREDVNIKVSADAAEMVRLWQAAKEGPEKMAAAMEDSGRRGKGASRSLAGEVEGLVGKWTSVAALIATAKAALDQYAATQRRIAEEEQLRAGSTTELDTLISRLQTQAGGTLPPGASQQVIDTATARGVPTAQAFGAATQLVSSGATVEEATGGALDEVLQLLNATNATGKNVDSTELIKALVQFLTANQLEANAQNIRQVGTAVQRLFVGTNLQIGNLARFAPEAFTIGQFSGLGPEESLAVYSQFLDVMDEATGAVAFRKGVTSLATAGATPSGVRALKMLGLSPEDVDFAGEDFETVLMRLAGGFEGLSQDQRNIAAKQLFGERGLGFYNVLANRAAIVETQRRLGLTGDEAAYQQTVAIAEGTRAAEETRAGVVAQAAQFDTGAASIDAVRNRLRARLAKSRLDEYARAQVLDLFDEPIETLLGFIPISFDPTAEGRARRAALRIAGSEVGMAQNSAAIARREALTNEITQQLLGGREIRVRLETSEGRDIPARAEVNDLGQPIGVPGR